MRIRTVKPQLWTNEGLSRVSEGVLLVAIALLNYADDEGYFNANERLVECALFPLRDLSVTIQAAFHELCGLGFIELVAGEDGRTYGRIVNFLKHQRINRPTPSVIKDLRDFTESSVSPLGGLKAGIRNKEGNKEGNGGKERKRRKNLAVFSEFSPEVQKLVADLAELMGRKLKDNDKHWWADVLDKCIRLDKRPIFEVRDVVFWAASDEFWKDQFRSPRKLRRKNKDGESYYDVFLRLLKTNERKRTKSMDGDVSLELERGY